MNKSIKKSTIRRKSVRRKSVRRKSIRRKSIRRKSVRRKSVRRKSVRRKSKNNKDGVKPLPSDVLVNIRELSTCQDEHNLLASNVIDINDFTITANTCLKVKFLYIIIKLNIGGFLRNMIENERKTFITKLRVYLCLNPLYIPELRFGYDEINALLTNIILIEAGTQPLTTANNDTIYVLNCPYVDVPADFRGVTLHIKTSQIVNSPDWLRSVVFYGFEEIIGDGFCRENIYILSVSYRGMPSLRTVGDYWMFLCIALETVDLRGLTSLRTVGNNWMCNCNALTTINFKGLTSLRTVGGYWMFYCWALITVDFTGLTSLQTVGDYWMSGCRALRTVDFTGLTNLQTVGDYWMNDCPALTTVDLRGLTSLQTVGRFWMYNCRVVETININSNQYGLLIHHELQRFAIIV